MNYDEDQFAKLYSEIWYELGEAMEAEAAARSYATLKYILEKYNLSPKNEHHESD